MRKEHVQAIEKEFRNCVKNTLTRLSKSAVHKPFHEALLSREAVLWSAFERSFSTSFGQRAIEEITKISAISGGSAGAQRQKVSEFDLDAGQLRRIDQHLSALRHNSLGRQVNWCHDLAWVREAAVTGELDRQRVISDFWFQKDGIENFVSIKTVKPNIDQTVVAKQDMLKLKLAFPESKVYFGLYYNPYGEARSEYAWSPPSRVFDMQSDEVILIGNDYWDTIGGAGTYDTILKIVRQVGEEPKSRLEGLYD